MAVREILKMGDARLLQTAQKVPLPMIGSKTLENLLQDMFDTMKSAGGVGLAAPQIGESWQVIIFGTGTMNQRYPSAPIVEPTVLINPSIEPVGNEKVSDWEGCLSIPNLRGKVPRFERILYRGLDTAGNLIKREVNGFHARVVQHECDHLKGTLYPMQMEDFTQFGYIDVLSP